MILFPAADLGHEISSFMDDKMVRESLDFFAKEKKPSLGRPLWCGLHTVCDQRHR